MDCIPEFDCVDGCHECCGVVPFNAAEKSKAEAKMTLLSWQKFDDSSWVATAALQHPFSCPFLGNKGCTIYDDRPMICRLFGSVDDPRMKCPKGCGPEQFITETESRQILTKGA